MSDPEAPDSLADEAPPSISDPAWDPPPVTQASPSVERTPIEAAATVILAAAPEPALPISASASRRPPPKPSRRPSGSLPSVSAAGSGEHPLIPPDLTPAPPPREHAVAPPPPTPSAATAGPGDATLAPLPRPAPDAGAEPPPASSSRVTAMPIIAVGRSPRAPEPPTPEPTPAPAPAPEAQPGAAPAAPAIAAPGEPAVAAAVEPAAPADAERAAAPEVPATPDPDLQELSPDDVEQETEEASPDSLEPDSLEPESIDARPASEHAVPKRPPPPPKRPSAVGPTPAPSAPGKRLPAPPPPPKELTGAPRQPRAWWEEVFGEDFSRAVPRVADRHIRREADFLEESLGVAAGGVLLDLACGGGQHAVELASRGYGVVGYDLSLHQLALASDLAQEAQQKINFMQGDMREMAFEETFDGIYCWNSSFGFFEDEKNLAVAQRIHRALRSGGTFVLDLVNRDFAVANQPSSVWYEGDGCLCMDDMSVDFITSRLRVKRSLMLDDGRSLECAYSLRLYSLQEIGKLLHEVGFKVTEASGHPATPGTFLGACSPRLIILATKP